MKVDTFISKMVLDKSPKSVTPSLKQEWRSTASLAFWHIGLFKYQRLFPTWIHYRSTSGWQRSLQQHFTPRQRKENLWWGSVLANQLLLTRLWCYIAWQHLMLAGHMAFSEWHGCILLSLHICRPKSCCLAQENAHVKEDLVSQLLHKFHWFKCAYFNCNLKLK